MTYTSILVLYIKIYNFWVKDKFDFKGMSKSWYYSGGMFLMGKIMELYNSLLEFWNFSLVPFFL